MKKKILSFSPLEWLTILWPILLYPVAFFPYKLWGMGKFANLVRFIIYGEQGNPMWVAFNVRETIIFFWLALSIAVILACIVMAAVKVRPWYFIPVYLIVMMSMCGILSLAFYNATA